MNWNPALLSLFVPGWGQFEQHRIIAGRVFLGWAGLSLLFGAYAPMLGLPSSLGWSELAIATLWATLDALVTPPAVPGRQDRLAHHSGG